MRFPFKRKQFLNVWRLSELELLHFVAPNLCTRNRSRVKISHHIQPSNLSSALGMNHTVIHQILVWYYNKLDLFPWNPLRMYKQRKLLFFSIIPSSAWVMLLKPGGQEWYFVSKIVITWTIYSNKKRSVQFLKQNAFEIFLRSNKFKQFEFKLKDIIGI